MDSAFSLQGRNVLVTGASSGLGRAVAVVVSRLGANVIMIGRNEERLARTQELLASAGRHVRFAQDLTDFGALDALVKGGVAQLGPIAGFVHSAGLGLTLPLRNTTPKHLERLFAVNVHAAIELCRLLARRECVAPGGSSFVLISSVMGLVGGQAKTAYCCTKGALLPAAKAMALELASQGIRVNCVLPGVVESEMASEYFGTVSEETRAAVVAAHPLGLGKPEDVAHACAFLLSDAARWVTGSDVVVDGGYSAQ